LELAVAALPRWTTDRRRIRRHVKKAATMAAMTVQMTITATAQSGKDLAWPAEKLYAVPVTVVVRTQLRNGALHSCHRY